MPKLGEIIIRVERAYSRFIWLACEKCGKERWVQLSHTTLPTYTGLCKKCSNHSTRGFYGKGKNARFWKGQPRITEHGYILVPVDNNDLFYSMNNEGSVYEHRLIMARHLGRCLEAWELVHHKNEIKTDNRIENLELLPSRCEHVRLHGWGKS